MRRGCNRRETDMTHSSMHLSRSVRIRDLPCLFFSSYHASFNATISGCKCDWSQVKLRFRRNIGSSRYLEHCGLICKDFQASEIAKPGKAKIQRSGASAAWNQVHLKRIQGKRLLGDRRVIMRLHKCGVAFRKKGEIFNFVLHFAFCQFGSPALQHPMYSTALTQKVATSLDFHEVQLLVYKNFPDCQFFKRIHSGLELLEASKSSLDFWMLDPAAICEHLVRPAHSQIRVTCAQHFEAHRERTYSCLRNLEFY